MDCSAVRIVFAGNPAVAVPSLAALHRHFTVVGVLTNPDRPVGRGRHPEAPPVKTQARQLGIPVLQFDRVLREAREQTAAFNPNLLVSFACGHFFGPKFLALFPFGAINIHPSLLPSYRGCAPIQYALLNGEQETGVTIQRIDSRIDSGNVLASRRIALTGTETSESLTRLVAPIAASMIVDTIQQLCKGEIVETVQRDELATYTSMLSKTDGKIDWREPARKIHSKVRAFYPWPKATTTYNGVQLTIASVHGPLREAGTDPIPSDAVPGVVVGLVKGKGLAVACGDGLLYVERLQLAQKREMDCFAFVNGNPRIIDAVLGT